MRSFTYIAADFDHDKDAVDHLCYLKNRGVISFLNAHELQQSYDSSLSCSIKNSLKYRMDNSYKFVLIVGSHTRTVTKGGCQLCDSYNSYTMHCARGYSVDYRSFIEYECDKAVEAGLEVVVLYKSTSVDRELCPECVRWQGSHQKMFFFGTDWQLHWDDGAIERAMWG